MCRKKWKLIDLFNIKKKGFFVIRSRQQYIVYECNYHLQT